MLKKLLKYSEEFNNKDLPNKGIEFLRTNFDDLIILPPSKYTERS